ncbi:hypothetical protein MPDQ_000959 [Monascus purpureus]|uniref:Histone deacetylase complex subunit SAP30 Sin3 binding domain-containing protein n=1 Tax=Monascus purpureus TaxID=5098 RepID=A0A507QS82_MONPU|nr:hypothetical protein MPDQ_000959 [Monascus purpureus]BDD56179.1 hypothetical protein MAP00_001654 [Monascus purpureus]
MAPPRKGATSVVDDSRSEASSGTRELKGTSSKSRKGINASGPRSATITPNMTGVPVVQAAEQTQDLPKVDWSEMPVEILHYYRHAYKLPTPSAFSREYSRILLSQGIGLRSPTSIAARRAQLSRDHEQDVNSHPHPALPGKGPSETVYSSESRQHTTGVHGQKDRLNHIIGQGRVSKDQLSLAVRKHFNSAGLVEQEAVARFLYKVREEGRGRQFRLRFQP